MWFSGVKMIQKWSQKKFRIYKQLETYNIQENGNTSLLELQNAIMFNAYKNSWINAINSDRGASTSGMNKLKTYKLFKDTYEVEAYVKTVMPRCHRSALARFRCGVASIRVETGRYERLPLDERLCPFCNAEIEDELHVLTIGLLYTDFRDELYTKTRGRSQEFNSFSCTEKMCFVLSDESLAKFTAKTCFDMLKHRRNLLYTT